MDARAPWPCLVSVLKLVGLQQRPIAIAGGTVDGGTKHHSLSVLEVLGNSKVTGLTFTLHSGSDFESSVVR